ncbi:pre-B lymphocyte protein 3-like isoform X2 [Aphelocoma coerulescens]|uniref:pre-B lymphocyte protein 3-like isoform X2 n=1 Tax=Aphelocoma coerulescens TaxID=39617 RepID=UPI0036046D3E
MPEMKHPSAPCADLSCVCREEPLQSCLTPFKKASLAWCGSGSWPLVYLAAEGLSGRHQRNLSALPISEERCACGTAAWVCVAPQTLSETASLPLPPAMALGFMVLLLVGTMGTASRAQPVLTQPNSVFVLPGQTARLFCTLSPQYNISQFGISWYQQRPGHSLRYLLYYNSERDKHKPAKIPDRFSATKDLASNACILTIASACQDDNGTYYCSLSPAFKWF